MVHEAYVRLAGADVNWNDRVHFFAVAARIMRRVLVDYGKQKRRQKRGGEYVRITLEENLLPPGEPATDIVAVDEALKRLAETDERQSRVVELTFRRARHLFDEVIELEPEARARRLEQIGESELELRDYVQALLRSADRGTELLEQAVEDAARGAMTEHSPGRIAAGTTWRQYGILGQLGAGGTGAVYRARDHKLGRQVAIKLLAETLASGPERLAIGRLGEKGGLLAGREDTETEAGKSIVREDVAARLAAEFQAAVLCLVDHAMSEFHYFDLLLEGAFGAAVVL